jgi:hypothetical protein
MLHTTQSDILRKNINQHQSKNDESKYHDSNIFSISKIINNEFETLYPQYYFGIDEIYPTHELLEIVDSNIYINKHSYFKPDGGLSWIKIKNKKYYYLFPEQKRQGTNDKRLLEGLNKQPQGNASERIADKLCLARILFGNENIFPFIVFLQGCDFYEKESTIPDRIKRIFNFIEPNVIHYEWIKLQKNNNVGGSYFMRGHSMNEVPGTSDWTMNEMYEIMKDIAKYSIEYYINKYGDK